MPLRHRLDFKQALSTLQRLQQEAGEEPQVPTQWEARSSSSTFVGSDCLSPWKHNSDPR